MPKKIEGTEPKFNLFDWHTSEDTYIILYYSYRKGRRFKYSTGLKIHANNWDRTKQRAIHSKRFPDSTHINARLETLKTYCLEIYHDNNQGRLSTADFRAQLLAKLKEGEPEDAPDPISFLEFIERAYNQKAALPTAKKGSLQVDHKVLVHLQNYARERGRKIAFTELGDTFYQKFLGWLHTPPRNLSTNYVHKIWGNLKYFIRRAEVAHLHNDRTYKIFKVPTAEITKIVLSFEQLAHLATIDFATTPHLEKARDLFLIGSYSGLRYSDFTRIRPEHITEHKGQKIIHLVTQKTGQTVYIPLHPILDSVLKKYGYTSPKMSNQKMNAHLKEVGRLAGLTNEIMVQDSTGGRSVERKKPMWELLATHVARRSFATNYYQAHPELIDNIMKITGHSTERMFRAYIVTDALDSALKFAEGIKK